MAILSASRYNPPIQALYIRLQERGKAVKVDRCAAARKLIHLAWAIMKIREYMVMGAITEYWDLHPNSARSTQRVCAACCVPSAIANHGIPIMPLFS